MNHQEYQALVILSQRMSRQPKVLDKTCDWVIDERADMAVCRQHGEVADGVDSKHFPGAERCIQLK